MTVHDMQVGGKKEWKQGDQIFKAIYGIMY